MSFRDPAAVFAWADSFTNLERNLPPLDKRTWRLDRMRRMLDETGSPDAAFCSFHVAGSKGKGSTAALMAAVLAASGRRTGLYTSPHVSDWIERIAIDGAPAAASLVTAAGDRARALVERLADSLPGGFAPTTFELLTLIAFLCFREAGCEDAVVEVGIGGRLDVTNVISPEASVVTPLDLEHTDILGDTIEEIAAEKAGIIKPGVPVFVAGRPPGTKEVFRRAAASNGAPLAFLDEEAEIGPAATGPGGTTFTVRLRGGAAGVVLPRHARSLPGRQRGSRVPVPPPVPPAHHARRRSARGSPPRDCPGASRSLPRIPPVVLDGAHTPLAVTRLLETFRAMYPDGGVLLFGSVSGKKPQEMAEILAPAFEQHRGVEAERLQAERPRRGVGDLPPTQSRARSCTRIPPGRSRAPGSWPGDGRSWSPARSTWSRRSARCCPRRPEVPAAATLNWREIDLVLSELDLAGCLVQEVRQPAHDRIVLDLFRPRVAGDAVPARLSLLVSLSNRFPRLHAICEPLPNPPKPPRFAMFLRAHVKGGRIETAGQVAGERVVRIDVARGDERLTLWIRLWASAANFIVTDADGVILDAMYRRPKRGEISGGRYAGPALSRRARVHRPRPAR